MTCPQEESNDAPLYRFQGAVGGWVYGLVIGHESTANFVPLNTADNWLDLALTVAMLGLGVALRPRAKATVA